MGARARTRSQTVGELGERLAALPARELAACIERAEALAGEIDPDELYAEDALLARLAGRPIAVDNPGVVVGRAVLADLSSVVEHLSERCGQTPGDLGAGALTAGELAERWSVSGKTVARYRRCGLIARRVRTGAGRGAVMFTRAAVERFERANAARLARAGRFSRQSELELARLERRARRYRARFGWSLNRVARRVAERSGRSVEGVRQALRRIDAGGAIFGASGPPGARERAVFARALRRGMEPSAIGERTGRSVASVRRGATEHRAAFLRGLDLSGPVLATFGRAEAREVLLAPAPVRSGLGAPGETGLAAFLRDARGRRVPERAVEDARVIAYHFLRFEAARRVAALDRTTAEPAQVDRAETDLRWASLLKAELVRAHLRLVVETLEGAAGGPLERVPARRLAALLRRAIAAASGAVDRYDPARGGRLAAPIGLAVSRLAAGWAHEGGARAGEPARAARVLLPGETLRDWTLGLDPWQRELALDPRVRAAAPGLGGRSASVLALRHGLGGGEPRTLAEAAEAMGTSVVHVARFEREAVRAALGVARGGGAGG